MAGETNLEKLKKGAEATFGAQSPLGGTTDQTMVLKSPTNKLIFDGYQAQLDLALRGTHLAMMAWENMNLDTGEHKNFRNIKDDVTQEVKATPIWVDHHHDIIEAVDNVEDDQLTCGGYSRRQYLGQIASMGPLETPETQERSFLDKLLKRK